MARGEIVICEGYTDVMAFALSGEPNAVATCGTALADDHFQIIKNLARKVILAYDSDAAGQGAAERWYEWEQRYDIQLEVADLPAGRDPADVWRDDPAAAREGGRARRSRSWSSASIARSRPPTSRASKVAPAPAEIAAAIIAEHPSDLVRDQYVMRVAAGLDIDADRLRDAVARTAGGGGDAADRTGSAPRRDARHRRVPRRVDRREVDLLLYAVHDPELVEEWLDARLFADPIARAAFEAVVDADDFHDALAATEGPVRDLLERVAVEEPDRRRRARNAARSPHGERGRTGRPARGFAECSAQATNVSSSVKVLLERAHDAEGIGDWDAVQRNATELLGWIEDDVHADNA